MADIRIITQPTTHEADQPEGDATVFDSVFKTICHKCPQLLVPFINEAFGRDYPDQTPILRYSDEHTKLRGTILSDAVFRLEDKLYHLECQSKNDASMTIRMIEYDFYIAMEGAWADEVPAEINFPASCVLYLRHNANTPDKHVIRVNMPNSDSHFDYECKVVKLQTYSSEEIFQKRLLMFLPYYLMRYEHDLGRIASDDTEVARLIAECSDLRVQLENLTARTGNTTLYEELVELIIRVTDHLFASQESLRKRVRGAMGGEVLELWRERAERMEREARQQGYDDGVEQGVKQGIEQGANDLARRLQERGVDHTLLEETLAGMSAES